MLSHVFVGISDFERAVSFYSVLMDTLELRLKFRDNDTCWAGWMAAGAPRPLFVIGRPYDGQPATVGNGQMLALLAKDRATVDRAHAAALAHGGACEGPPGLRPQYHPDYYGAYFRDPDGNKLCVCCHEPDPGTTPQAAR
ncbi:VOC family protein [Paraburkholderia fungorum]|uniref:VOC family protein n=1 Tax=Paraburkholderia fungorum TaxID=134537 RepID=UPI0020922EF8|nr:VOC family protein [Paraburkholderia fungorum]USU19953.1 VOC family protein [Paraburkholderia fungorum]USU28050.1 VOC family protein [Paraburkholderia fungorum]